MARAAPTVLTLLFILVSLSLVSAVSIPFTNIKGQWQAPSIFKQDLTGFGSPRSQNMRAAAGSSECTNGGALYCCPGFIQSGVDGPCQDPLSVLTVQQCRKDRPHGMACCINEEIAEWYCWSL